MNDNRAERFTAKDSGTTRAGNNGSNVINSIRKRKMPPEEVWPYAEGMTWDTYYSPIPASVYEEALKWEYGINHWAVNMRDRAQVTEAHKRFGSIVVAGDAWYMQNGLYFSPAPGRYGHMFVKAKDVSPGAAHLAFDSYSPFFKNLAPDYDFYQWGYVVDVFKVAGTTDGEKLYNVLLGKEILLTEEVIDGSQKHAKGEAYRTYPDYWDKTQIIISDKKLFDDANYGWRTKMSFVGVNAKVFLELKRYYEEKFGSLKVEELKVLFTGAELLIDPKVI